MYNVFLLQCITRIYNTNAMLLLQEHAFARNSIQTLSIPAGCAHADRDSGAVRNPLAPLPHCRCL